MQKKAYRSDLNYQLILNLFLFLVGIVFMIFPHRGLAFITWVIGIALCLAGVVCAVIFILNRQNPKVPLLIGAAVALVCGVLVMVFRMQIATFGLPTLIGLWVIASAVLCFMSSMGYKKAGAPLWWLPLVAALVAIIVAVLIFVNLTGTARLLGYIIGLYFIVFSGIRIGEYITLRKYL